MYISWLPVKPEVYQQNGSGCPISNFHPTCTKFGEQILIGTYLYFQYLSLLLLRMLLTWSNIVRAALYMERPRPPSKAANFIGILEEQGTRYFKSDTTLYSVSRIEHVEACGSPGCTTTRSSILNKVLSACSPNALRWPAK